MSVAATAYIVRFGQMRSLGEFTADDGLAYVRGDRVIAQTDRGVELVEVLRAVADDGAGSPANAAHGRILRAADATDLAAQDDLKSLQREAFATCLELIGRRGLQMDLVDVEAILGRERLVFFYLSEKRVDFRELVKDLARVFRTRIEMRQIGVRDEAKLLADYGDCGKPVCCNTHLSRMPPVSMRMAKLQKTTLDPAKISGRCGRLKCCLRYEFDGYMEMESQLPPVGATVVTARGAGRVLSHEILTQRVLLELDDHRRIIARADEISRVEVNPRSRNTRDRRTQDDENEPADE